MRWDYRLIRRKRRNPVTEQDEFYYGVHEAYYSTSSSYTPDSYTAEAVVVVGDSIEDVCCQLQQMLAALDKPIVLGYPKDDVEPPTAVTTDLLTD